MTVEEMKDKLEVLIANGFGECYILDDNDLEFKIRKLNADKVKNIVTAEFEDVAAKRGLFDEEENKNNRCKLPEELFHR